jgi:uncharacterized membrane protein YcaP (DUF421 family)
LYAKNGKSKGGGLIGMHLTVILVRTFITFSVLLILTRILGKEQMSQLTFFHYITGITIGNIASSAASDRTVNFIEALTSLTAWVLLAISAGYIALKSTRARAMIDGEPTIVIKEGKILEKAMASLRLNMDDLSMLLRTQKIFSIKEVDYAIFEPNGKLTVLKKPEKQLVTKQDLQLPVSKSLYFPTKLIEEGKVITRNLRELNLNAEWLEHQLKVAGASLEDVFYAEIQSDGSLYIDKKQDSVPLQQ